MSDDQSTPQTRLSKPTSHHDTIPFMLSKYYIAKKNTVTVTVTVTVLLREGEGEFKEKSERV